MDQIDRRILHELQQDARLANAELAARVGLTASPCLRRVRQLEAAGVIRGYRALLDYNSLNCELQAFVTLVMHREDRSNVERFEHEVAQLPPVIEAHRLFGDPDYLLRVAVHDVQAYERFYSEVLCDLPGVVQVTSHLIMKEVKQDRGIPTGSGQ
ncbi:Lrp/AsnC family transcriptional regulator [Streptomyces albospinus]|uniref:Lrp/AsnC family transcriptional regulator n=1 Tax=Streptomyces albospinus TaxID=285515 RepID=UPI00166FC562|nr:Lrp/AsnC family transcriptional regulator [Streptomyces albospinus]